MRYCWLCGKPETSLDTMDTHHIFGGSNRKKSERMGLTVNLHHNECHIFGKRAAHNCGETMQALHEYGQRVAMENMGWSKDDFRREFGRNYL